MINALSHQFVDSKRPKRYVPPNGVSFSFGIGMSARHLPNAFGWSKFRLKLGVIYFNPQGVGDFTLPVIGLWWRFKGQEQ